MSFLRTFHIALIAGAMAASMAAQTPSAKPAAPENKGLPPRATPAEYQAKAQAGDVIIAAEFRGHSIPTMDGTLSTEDYVVVEVAYFGAPGSKLTISAEDFTLHINGSKKGLPSQPFGAVMTSVKDPEWTPPEPPAEKKSKGGLTSGGGGGGGEADSEPKVPPKVPIEVQRAMAKKVQQSALPGGERVLPQAGLIYFQHRGKVQNIHSLELDYAGPAGKATIKMNQ